MTNANHNGALPAPAAAPARDFEDLLRLAGTRGKRNIFITIMSSMTSLILGINVFSYQFIGATPGYSCYVEALHKGTSWTPEQIINLTSPIEFKNNKERFSSCSTYNFSYSDIASSTYEEATFKVRSWTRNHNESIPCTKRRFEEGDTVVTKWDLVCDRRYLFTWTQGGVQLGLMVGSIIMGYLIDRFGRKKIYIYCVILFILSGGIAIGAPNIELFIFLRTISGATGLGFYMALFVSAMENCLSEERSMIGSYFIIPWALGMMITPGVAKLVTEWRMLQVALSAPALILVVNFWLVPESSRWLVMNGHHKKAYNILKKFAEANKRPFPQMETVIDDMKIIQDSNSKADKTLDDVPVMMKIKAVLKRFLALLIIKKFRIQTLLVFYCWFAAALVYYGISLSAPGITDDDYLYLFIGGVLELLSYLLLLPALHYLGRRLTLVFSFALCAVCILGALLLLIFTDENDFYELKLILYLLGRFAIISAFQIVWVWTAELYPTRFRSLAVGEASTFGRVGSIFSPFINDLLSEVRIWIPALLFGTFSLLAIFCSYTLKETNNQNLNENINEKSGKENPAFVSEAKV